MRSVFSQNTGIPACTAARISRACAGVAAAITNPVHPGGQRRLRGRHRAGAELVGHRSGHLGTLVGDDKFVHSGQPAKGFRVKRADPAKADHSKCGAISRVLRSQSGPSR